MTERKYFGTDGVRGKVGTYPITPEFVLKLGWAMGIILKKHLSPNQKAKVLIGKDTRISGYMLETALEAGLSSAGIFSYLVGPMPTPAIAFLTKSLRLDAGIVVSASHNPFYDNGIKFFSGEGRKFPDEVELEIERILEENMVCVESELLGKAKRVKDADGRYIEFCKSTFPNELTLRGLKIVMDCANGATYNVAPQILNELDATLIPINIEPNGVNINLKCGATDVKALQAKVLEQNADIGIAYDGDGDRLILVDHLGNLVDGDQILYLLTKQLLSTNQLKGGVVGTLMTNMGLELALKELNIPFARAKVGDRYVLEIMEEKGWNLGGENSGHIILSDKNTTGDGVIASLAVLAEMVKTGKSLNNLLKEMYLLPQKLINVSFDSKKNPLSDQKVQQAISDIEKSLIGEGRLLIRKSGTEPLIRVMVECADINLAEKQARTLAEIIENF